LLWAADLSVSHPSILAKAHLYQHRAQSHVQQQADLRPAFSLSPRTKRRQQQKTWAEKAALKQAHQQQQLDSQPNITDTGFKQGFTLAPDLFNIVLDTIVRQLLPQLRKLGVKIAYKIDGQFMHSSNPDAEELMWILLYADDISLVCDDIESLRAAVTLMDATFVQWGLTISTKKTKVLVVGKDAAEQSANAVITIRGEVLEVFFFFFLGYRGIVHHPSGDGGRGCFPFQVPWKHVHL